MNKDKSRISTKEAAKEVGVTPRTLKNYIINGKLSATRDSNGNYQIDKSEFYRVFPDLHKEKQQEKIKGNSQEFLEAENKHLKDMVSFLNKRLEASEEKEVALIKTLSSNLKLLEYQAINKKTKRFFGWF